MVNILFWNNTDFLITSALSSVLEMAQWVDMSEPACVMRNAVGSSLDSNRNFFCALHIVFIISSLPYSVCKFSAYTYIHTYKYNTIQSSLLRQMCDENVLTTSYEKIRRFFGNFIFWCELQKLQLEQVNFCNLAIYQNQSANGNE